VYSLRTVQQTDRQTDKHMSAQSTSISVLFNIMSMNTHFCQFLLKNNLNCITLRQLKFGDFDMLQHELYNYIHFTHLCADN